LIRVGIDSRYGEWNAPCNPNTGNFVYVPIPEEDRIKKEFEKPYTIVLLDIENFVKENQVIKKIKLPDKLYRKNMHLDPDFNHLTYGDNGKGRGQRLGELDPGDFVAFYASFRPVVDYPDNLVYALMGFYEVKKVLNAYQVPKEELDYTAHTRKKMIYEHDFVLMGKPENSGRFSRLLPIGEYREKAYRVKKDVLEAWGGIDIKNGFLQRNNPYPWFTEPDKFLKWLERKDIELIRRNN
jgi:hypothetical protein